MRVFVTGATGFIGMALTKELVAAGHSVLGLCRSKEKAPALAALGAEVLAGALDDETSLKRGAERADGVVHLAFNHDFSQYAANCEDDRRVITVLGSALAGSRRPLVVTSGTGMGRVAPGELATEQAPPVDAAMIPRALTEVAAAAVAKDGVNVSVVRLPQVHDTHRQGFVSLAIQAYLEKRTCAYVGDGRNRWPAVHVADAARLYRLAVEKAAPNAIYHAVGEEGVSVKDIATVLGRRLDLPVKSIAAEEAPAFFGFLAMFAALDMPASSEKTRAALGWQPAGPTMLADLANLELPGGAAH